MEPLSIIWSTEKRKVKDLIPADYNPRKISEKQREDLKQSISEFNEVEPVVINLDNKLIGGHQRLSIYLEKGITEIDVRVPNRQLTIEEEKRLNIRLNKNVAEFDFTKLAQEFNADILEQVGFDTHELDFIFKPEDAEDKFDVESHYKKISEPKAKIGDVYQLGTHRLMCGDSTKNEDVAKLMDGKLADMVFTDPPYNVNYSSRGAEMEGIMNDDMKDEDFYQFVLAFMVNMKEFMNDKGVYYICTGYVAFPVFRYVIEQVGLVFSCPIIWVKNQISMGWNDYRHKQEMMVKARKDSNKALPIMYGWKGGGHYFAGDRTEADVWEVKRRAANTMVHPTQKPLELVSRAIRNSSRRDEIIMDLFGGSGSTLISAEKEGRIAYLMEMDPKFVDVIIQRWEALTSGTAQKVESIS